MDNPFEFHEEDGIIACVGNNGGTTDEDIRNGFKRTVELLTESLKNGQEVEDLLVYPIVYNARHSIELSLKIVIKMLWEIEKKKGIGCSNEILTERKRNYIPITLKNYIKWRMIMKILIKEFLHILKI